MHLLLFGPPATHEGWREEPRANVSTSCHRTAPRVARPTVPQQSLLLQSEVLQNSAPQGGCRNLRERDDGEKGLHSLWTPPRAHVSEVRLFRIRRLLLINAQDEIGETGSSTLGARGRGRRQGGDTRRPADTDDMSTFNRKLGEFLFLSTLWPDANYGPQRYTVTVPYDTPRGPYVSISTLDRSLTQGHTTPSFLEIPLRTTVVTESVTSIPPRQKVSLSRHNGWVYFSYYQLILVTAFLGAFEIFLT